MTLRSFLDAAYSLLVEAWMNAGQDLLSAIERVNQSIGLTTPQEVAVAHAERVPSASENDRSMAELQEMLKGVKML